ncbi:tautomerase family protein [Algoriphagus sp. PAP.12]|uniref:tautomerase family protein n=1 Tax=Algoriphagus sp. PAP.12 TaxID=2996678 RepID=UPI00227C1151|nr:tautomerase family protein [Algoriphagus sp. PAP.12]
MPHFQIKILEGKSQEQKERLTKEIIQAAQKVIGMGDESYSVSIEEFSMDEWRNDLYPNSIMSNKEILIKEPGYSFD